MAQMSELVSNLTTVWSCIDKLETKFAVLGGQGGHATREELGQIEDVFKNFFHAARGFQANVDKMLAEMDNAPRSPHDMMQLPTRQEAERRLKEYFEPMPTKGPPLAIWAGCYARKILDKAEQQKRLIGSFICARVYDTFALRVFLQWGEAGGCTAFDPTSANPRVEKFEPGEWTPLPIVIPEKPLKRWEHVAGTNVLTAIKRNGEWTTVFFKAVVKTSPTDRPDGGERGYELTFENESIIVPEQYVVQMPPDWA